MVLQQSAKFALSAADGEEPIVGAGGSPAGAVTPPLAVTADVAPLPTWLQKIVVLVAPESETARAAAPEVLAAAEEARRALAERVEILTMPMPPVEDVSAVAEARRLYEQQLAEVQAEFDRRAAEQEQARLREEREREESRRAAAAEEARRAEVRAAQQAADLEAANNARAAEVIRLEAAEAARLAAERETARQAAATEAARIAAAAAAAAEAERVARSTVTARIAVAAAAATSALADDPPPAPVTMPPLIVAPRIPRPEVSVTQAPDDAVTVAGEVGTLPAAPTSPTSPLLPALATSASNNGAVMIGVALLMGIVLLMGSKS